MNTTDHHTTHHVLSRVGEQIVNGGTRGCRPVLEAMSAALRDFSPGVAAALVDWDGPEVARQRAFGLAHGLVVNVLDPSSQRSLLHLIESRSRTSCRYRSRPVPSRRAAAVPSWA